MSATCERLHNLVHELPEVSWPFTLDQLPRNGIYFFCERGEKWGHGGDRSRIVRVGTHREGNFRSRMADHYVINERKMGFDRDRPPPKDRSIFRKNIGRALLNRDADPYAVMWEVDFTTRQSRATDGRLRNVEKEREVEREVTRILRERFTFRWIELEGQAQRMGSHGLEALLIGTLAGCTHCRPSSTWLGRFSPKPKIAQSGLWLEHHLSATGLTEEAISQIASLFSAKRA